MPEARAKNLVVLLLYPCDALAPLLGLACMLGSGVDDHCAYLDCCTMQAMMVCLLMHSYDLMMLLPLG